MIHDEFCTYEVAKLAKEKGFDEATYYTYEEESKRLNRMRYCVKRNSRIGSIIKLIAAPTQSLLQRWLREEKGIHIEIVATACGYFWIADKTNGTAITDSDVLDRGTNEGGCWDEYELALEDALKYALENLVKLCK